MSTRATFRIHNVKCIDETGGWLAEKVGNDEIFLSGFGIDPAAQTHKVNPFEVYAHFDDGDIKRYSPPRPFISLALDAGGEWPKAVSVGLLLAEKDWGDFGQKVDQVLAKVQEHLNQSGGIPGAGGWGVILQPVAKYVLDKVIGVARDDVFALKDVNLMLPAPDFTWDGNTTSPPASVDFKGHNGYYRLTYDWVLN